METFKQEVSRHSFDSLDIDLEGKAMLQRDSLDHHRRRVSMAAAEADFRRQPLSSTNPKRRRFNALILPASVAANAVLFAFALFLLAHPCYFSARNCVYRQEDGKGEAVVDDGLKLMGEINGLVPEFGLEKVTFMNDSRYSTEQMFDDEATHDAILKQWEDDMPLGRGFITIPPESVHLLPRPYHIKSNPNANGYSIASLHQFHCIYMIMRSHGNLKLNRTEHHNAEDMDRHVTHCFDYLRQSAQCAGDSTLEGKSETVRGMTDGWGNVHVCKKNSELVGWVLKNRLSNNTGIH